MPKSDIVLAFHSPEERRFGEQAATAYLDSLKQQRVRLFTKGKNVDYVRDLAAAIRLGTAAFPESGQKRLVLMTDGNENMGDALNAALAA